MRLDVARARAAVGQAALARDEVTLRAIADSLPPLAAYAYERHRARAFANAIRGARDSAVAELCLGVAACPPAASTFVADSAQLRLLAGDGPGAPEPSPVRLLADRARPRLILSAAAVAAAVAALAVLPLRSFDERRPEASGVTAPSRTTEPRVVAAEPRVAPGRAEAGANSRAGDDAAAEPTPIPVVAASRAPGAESGAPVDSAPAPAAATRRPPNPAAPPAPAPTPPAEPGPRAAPPPPPPSPPVAAAEPAPTAAAPLAEPAKPRRKGKAVGHAHAPGQAKKADPPAPPAPAPAGPPTDVQPAGPPAEHPGRGHGADDRGGGRP